MQRAKVSHMAVIQYPNEALQQKVNNLMEKLTNLEKSAILWTNTPLHPVIRNDTQWWSTYAMIKIYFEIVCFLDKTDPDIVISMLAPSEEANLREIQMRIKTRTEKLTKKTITLKLSSPKK